MWLCWEERLTVIYGRRKKNKTRMREEKQQWESKKGTNNMRVLICLCYHVGNLSKVKLIIFYWFAKQRIESGYDIFIISCLFITCIERVLEACQVWAKYWLDYATVTIQTSEKSPFLQRNKKSVNFWFFRLDKLLH